MCTAYTSTLTTEVARGTKKQNRENMKMEEKSVEGLKPTRDYTKEINRNREVCGTGRKLRARQWATIDFTSFSTPGSREIRSNRKGKEEESVDAKGWRGRRGRDREVRSRSAAVADETAFARRKGGCGRPVPSLPVWGVTLGDEEGERGRE